VGFGDSGLLCWSSVDGVKDPVDVKWEYRGGGKKLI